MQNDITETLKKHQDIIEKQAAEIAALKTLINKDQSASQNKDDEFVILKNLLFSSHWPQAIEENLICKNNSEQDKVDRAAGMLDQLLDTHLEGLKFLDFGCGEGHTIFEALKQKPIVAVGYDIKEYDYFSMPGPDNAMLTTSWDKVTNKGPYNIILLYDVIDHIMGENFDIINALIKAKSVLAPNGKIFVSCHPWCSRHGCHLHHEINKAFVHIVFNPDEIKELGFTGIETREIIHPLATYESAFKEAGLKVMDMKSIRSPIEKFFVTTPLIAKRIKSRWKNSPDKDLRSGKKFPMQLDFQFVNYILS